VIGLAPRGRVRLWKIAAAVTALRRAFPWTEIRSGGWSKWHHSYLFVVDGRGALLVSPALLERCADEAAVMASIAKAVPMMRAEIRVELTAEGRIMTPIAVEHRPVVLGTWSPGSLPPSSVPTWPRSRSRRY